VRLQPEGRPSSPYRKVETKPLKTRWTDLDHKIVEDRFKLTMWLDTGTAFATGELDDLTRLAESVRGLTARMRRYVIATLDGKVVREML
jgi:hypothetical protein